jgi:hypothetical protein
MRRRRHRFTLYSYLEVTVWREETVRFGANLMGSQDAVAGLSDALLGLTDQAVCHWAGMRPPGHRRAGLWLGLHTLMWQAPKLTRWADLRQIRSSADPAATNDDRPAADGHASWPRVH